MNGIAAGDEVAAQVQQALEELLVSPPVGANERARTCLEIELALAEPPFDGLPLGSTLTDHLSGLIYSARHTPTVRDAMRDAVALMLHRIRGLEPPPRDGAPSGTERGKVLVALISARSYHREWVPGLLGALGTNRCRLITPDASMPAPAGIEVSRWHEMPQIPMRRWRRDLARVESRWRRRLRRLGEEWGLSWASRRILLHGMIAASHRVRRCGALLDVLRPRAVLVEYDRNTRGSALVLAARSRRVPTLTLLHGAINGPFGYTPVLADRVLCWGDIQKRQLMELGTPEERIDIVGFERLNPGCRVDGGELRAKFGIGTGTFLVTLATNSIAVSEARKLAVVFCESVGRANRALGMVRLHPSERLATYDSVRQKYPSVRFLANDEISQDDAVAMSDVIVVHSSGFGSEAMAKGRLCVVLDVLDAPLGHGEDIVRFGGAPKARSAGELAAILERIRTDAAYRQELDRSRRRFVRQMFAAFGEEAVSNIARAIETTALREQRGHGDVPLDGRRPRERT